MACLGHKTFAWIISQQLFRKGSLNEISHQILGLPSPLIHFLL